MELLNCKVIGICCDACGGNALLYKYIREDKKIDEELSIFLNDHVCFPNPAFPNRFIFIFHCTAHVLKSFRTQLYQSRVKGTKTLTTKDNVVFGWEPIPKPYELDNQSDSAR